MMSYYNIESSTQPWVIHDGEDHGDLLFHVDHNDYFGTLATILDLFKQRLAGVHFSPDPYNQKNQLLLGKLIDELLFLQKNYRIVKKNL